MWRPEIPFQTAETFAHGRNPRPKLTNAADGSGGRLFVLDQTGAASSCKVQWVGFRPGALPYIVTCLVDVTEGILGFDQTKPVAEVSLAIMNFGSMTNSLQGSIQSVLFQ
jgi:hypothetical protein